MADWMIAGVELAIALVAGLVAYGSLTARVDAQDKRISELEDTAKTMVSQAQFNMSMEKITGLEAHIMRLIEMVAELRGKPRKH